MNGPHPLAGRSAIAAGAVLFLAALVLAPGKIAYSDPPTDELANLLEGREICFDERGLIVRNPSPVCENTPAVHKLDDGRDTAKLEGWYWLGVWLRSHTPGLKSWEHERKLSLDEVLRLLEPHQDGVFHRHPTLAPWDDPWNEETGTSSDQLIPLIAAMGVWEKYTELHRLWNALPEDLLGRHAFNGRWMNVLGQPGSNCAEIRRAQCAADPGCSFPDDPENCGTRADQDCSAEAKYQACQATNIFSGDLIGPDVVNLFWRATNVNPLSVFPGNTPVQGGMIGEQQLMIKTYTRIAEASVAGGDSQGEIDNVDSDLNLIVQLLMARLRFGSSVSEAAAVQYAHLRPLTFGSWLGTYYKLYGGDTVDQDIAKRMFAGIEDGWHPDVSVLNGVVRWYHRPGIGGNPQLATLYEPVIDRYLSGAPSPVAKMTSPSAAPYADDLVEMERRAADFASFYWIHVANENAQAIKYLSETYADFVEYYGKRVAKSKIIAEKRRFIERWPDRNYRPRWQDAKIVCDPASQQCTIEGIADFEAKSVTRGRKESGTFRYSMRIQLVESHARIVAENSEVIARSR